MLQDSAVGNSYLSPFEFSSKKHLKFQYIIFNLTYKSDMSDVSLSEPRYRIASHSYLHTTSSEKILLNFILVPIGLKILVNRGACGMSAGGPSPSRMN